MGPDYPLYAFRSPGLVKGEPLADVQKMAERYIRELLQVKKTGPYVLCGYSFGGLVAFEMAQQLTRSGHTVKRVITIDSIAPYDDCSDAFRMDDGKWLLAVSKALKNIFKNGFSVSENDFAGKEPYDQEKIFTESYLKSTSGNSKGQEQFIARLLNVTRNNYNSMLTYKPQKYPGSIVVIKAKEPVKESEIVTYYGNLRKEDYGWQELCENQNTMHFVDGNHYSIFEEPQVAQLGKLIRSIL
jgi:thioesterase domain-containing protein